MDQYYLHLDQEQVRKLVEDARKHKGRPISKDQYGNRLTADEVQMALTTPTGAALSAEDREKRYHEDKKRFYKNHSINANIFLDRLTNSAPEFATKYQTAIDRLVNLTARLPSEVTAKYTEQINEIIDQQTTTQQNREGFTGKALRYEGLAKLELLTTLAKRDEHNKEHLKKRGRLEAMVKGKAKHYTPPAIDSYMEGSEETTLRIHQTIAKNLYLEFHASLPKSEKKEYPPDLAPEKITSLNSREIVEQLSEYLANLKIVTDTERVANPTPLVAASPSHSQTSLSSVPDVSSFSDKLRQNKAYLKDFIEHSDTRWTDTIRRQKSSSTRSHQLPGGIEVH